MKTTQERLNELAYSSGLEPCDSVPVYDGVMVGEIVAMAKELLAHRKAWSEPVAYLIQESSPGGRASWVSLHGLEHISQEEIIEYEMTQEPIYRKPFTD